MGVEEGEEEEADFIRESITKGDPPNAHQAQHRSKTRFDEGVASVQDYLICSSAVVFTLIDVDTCQGACKLRNWCRAVRSPLSALWFSGEEADMCATVAPRITTKQQGSRTPPFYTLSCV